MHMIRQRCCLDNCDSFHLAYLPVYLEDLGTPANLTLYFRSSYPLVQEDKTLNKALTDACFSVCFADEAEKEAYTEKLRQTVDALEKED